MEPPTQSIRARISVLVAGLISKAKPYQIEKIQRFLSRRARPATAVEVSRAIDSVVAISLVCAGQGCLPRSIAVSILCRMNGVWPEWCVGVRREPFMAHAWLEVNGEPIREPFPAGYLQTLNRVVAKAG
ncbi:lasso peptide biosynthesis B2 protein [Glutamicibacter sp. NPDC087344]|uniref:lasso peptide biosynthesis B2 protein n=1 Tax=Glutamicibacter sp. NPDC087344 TaxID=3363994 RepID=UPI0037FE3E9F